MAKISQIKLTDTTYNLDVASELKATKIAPAHELDETTEKLVVTQGAVRTEIDELATKKLDKAPADGIALLDENNKINVHYLSDTLLGQLKFGGTITSIGTDTSSINWYLSPSSLLWARLQEVNSEHEGTWEGLYFQQYNIGTEDENNIVLATWIFNDGNRYTSPVISDMRYFEGFYFILAVDSPAGIDTTIVPAFNVGDWWLFCDGNVQKIDNTDTITHIKDADTSLLSIEGSGLKLNDLQSAQVFAVDSIVASKPVVASEFISTDDARPAVSMLTQGRMAIIGDVNNPTGTDNLIIGVEVDSDGISIYDSKSSRGDENEGKILLTADSLNPKVYIQSKTSSGGVVQKGEATIGSGFLTLSTTNTSNDNNQLTEIGSGNISLSSTHGATISATHSLSGEHTEIEANRVAIEASSGANHAAVELTYDALTFGMTNSDGEITATSVSFGPESVTVPTPDGTNPKEAVNIEYFHNNATKVDWEHIDSEVHVINNHSVEIDGGLIVHGKTDNNILEVISEVQIENTSSTEITSFAREVSYTFEPYVPMDDMEHPRWIHDGEEFPDRNDLNAPYWASFPVKANNLYSIVINPDGGANLMGTSAFMDINGADQLVVFAFTSGGTLSCVPYTYYPTERDNSNTRYGNLTFTAPQDGFAYVAFTNSTGFYGEEGYTACAFIYETPQEIPAKVKVSGDLEVTGDLSFGADSHLVFGTIDGTDFIADYAKVKNAPVEDDDVVNLKTLKEWVPSTTKKEYLEATYVSSSPSGASINEYVVLNQHPWRKNTSYYVSIEPNCPYTIELVSNGKISGQILANSDGTTTITWDQESNTLPCADHHNVEVNNFDRLGNTEIAGWITCGEPCWSLEEYASTISVYKEVPGTGSSDISDYQGNAKINGDLEITGNLKFDGDLEMSSIEAQKIKVTTDPVDDQDVVNLKALKAWVPETESAVKTYLMGMDTGTGRSFDLDHYLVSDIVDKLYVSFDINETVYGRLEDSDGTYIEGYFCPENTGRVEYPRDYSFIITDTNVSEPSSPFVLSFETSGSYAEGWDFLELSVRPASGTDERFSIYTRTEKCHGDFVATGHIKTDKRAKQATDVVNYQTLQDILKDEGYLEITCDGWLDPKVFEVNKLVWADIHDCALDYTCKATFESKYDYYLQLEGTAGESLKGKLNYDRKVFEVINASNWDCCEASDWANGIDNEYVTSYVTLSNVTTGPNNFTASLDFNECCVVMRYVTITKVPKPKIDPTDTLKKHYVGTILSRTGTNHYGKAEQIKLEVAEKNGIQCELTFQVKENTTYFIDFEHEDGRHLIAKMTPADWSSQNPFKLIDCDYTKSNSVPAGTNLTMITCTDSLPGLVTMTWRNSGYYPVEWLNKFSLYYIENEKEPVNDGAILRWRNGQAVWEMLPNAEDYSF